MHVVNVYLSIYYQFTYKRIFRLLITLHFTEKKKVQDNHNNRPLRFSYIFDKCFSRDPARMTICKFVHEYWRCLIYI